MYERGKWTVPKTSVYAKSSKGSSAIFRLLRSIYRFFVYYKDNIHAYLLCKAEARRLLLSDNFDVVITTYSPLGVTACGYYLKKRFKIKWIMDLRDLMDNVGRTPVMRRINRHFQNKYANAADVITTPTHGFLDEVLRKSGTLSPGYVIYNGFEDLKAPEDIVKSDEVLRFCYTGTIHEDLCTLVPLLNAISELINEGQIEKEKIVVEYAGKNSARFIDMMHSIKTDIPYVDRGYLSKSETLNVQLSSDIFLIMVMNLKDYTGVLTGKLCESIQNRLPVIGLVSGDLPGSELKTTIVKYNLGFCYEESSLGSYHELKSYVNRQYVSKFKNEMVEYAPNQSCYEDFNYRHIVDRLSTIINDL